MILLRVASLAVVLTALASRAAATAWDPDAVRARLVAYAAAYGVDAAALLRVVSCETGGTLAVDLVGASGERGPFQILPSTYARFRAAMPDPWSVGPDASDPDDNLHVGAWAWAAGHGGEWSCQP